MFEDPEAGAAGILGVYQLRTDEFRTDLLHLMLFEAGLLRPDKLEEPPDLEEPARALFWAFYSPSRISTNKEERDKPPSEMAEEELAAVLEVLERLEANTRVPYEPDAEYDGDRVDSLYVYVHVAACRALLLKKRDGYSDDVRQTLETAWGASRQIAWGEMLMYPPETEDVWNRSFAGVTGIVLTELFRLHSIDGQYEQALHLLSLSLYHCSWAILAAFGEEAIEYWRLKYESYIPTVDVDAQEAANVLLNLRATGAAKDWRRVVKDCRTIVASWGDCLRDYDEVIRDSEGIEWDWLSFWQNARGWAEAKIEPSELLEEMKKAEDERARQRLTTYFFTDHLWSRLSERAQRALVEADRVWFSTKVGRPETMLNELRVATEEILYSVFWIPLSEWLSRKGVKDPQLLDFHRIRERLRYKKHQPSLGEFEQMLGTRAFRTYLDTLSLSKENRAFTLRNLPRSLGTLRKMRASGEHHVGRIRSMKETAPLFREFMGVGRRGVLPRLVEMRVGVSKRKPGVDST